MPIECICPQCGCVFLMNPAHFQYGRRYCSLACGHMSRRTVIPTLCEFCGKSFPMRPSHPTTYCSKDCYATAQNLLLPQRFFAKVNKTETCWLWIGKRFSNGYGCFTMRMEGIRKYLLAHRFSYSLHYSTIPDDLFVLHDCPNGDTPACVNPEHLWVGTQAENMADMHQKGRACLGEKNGSVKLTDADIRAIFAL